MNKLPPMTHLIGMAGLPGYGDSDTQTAARSAEYSEGAHRILKERARQITDEGWDAKHDDEHEHEELAIAAACYATYGTYADALVYKSGEVDDAWPWEEKWDKRDKHSRIRQLEIAGALLAAEIDRLLRSKNS